MRQRKTTCCGVACAATHSSSSSRCSSDSEISVLFCAMQERGLPARHLCVPSMGTVQMGFKSPVYEP